MSQDWVGYPISVVGTLWTPRGGSFDGVDDSLSVPHSASIDFGLTNFSIEAVASFDAVNREEPIVFKGPTATTYTGYYLYTSSGVVRIYMMLDATVDFTLTHHTTCVANKYYHILASVDRVNNTAQLWLNGVASTNAVSTSGGFSSSTNISNSNTVIVGGKVWWQSQWFLGKYSEVMIYNRILTTQEALAHYLNSRRRLPWL